MSIRLINAAINGTTDLIEKVSSQASRAGSAAERVGRMLEAQVSPGGIALQVTKKIVKIEINRRFLKVNLTEIYIKTQKNISNYGSTNAISYQRSALAVEK